MLHDFSGTSHVGHHDRSTRSQGFDYRKTPPFIERRLHIDITGLIVSRDVARPRKDLDAIIERKRAGERKQTFTLGTASDNEEQRVGMRSVHDSERANEPAKILLGFKAADREHHLSVRRISATRIKGGFCAEEIFRVNVDGYLRDALAGDPKPQDALLHALGNDTDPVGVLQEKQSQQKTDAVQDVHPS